MSKIYNGGDWNQCIKDREYYKKKGYDFQTKRKGNVMLLTVNGRTWRYIDRENVSPHSGYHISKMVSKDVDQLVQLGEDIPYMDRLREQIFDIENCKNNIGKDGIAIDIANCYWITAHKLGIITEATFIKGLRKQQWKQGRNAAIGSLASKTIVQTFKLGSNVRKENAIIEPPDHREYARYLVLKYVFDTFMMIIEALNEQFCFYLTDCIFIARDTKAVKKVFEILSARGYSEYKTFSFEITKVKEGKKQVHWKDYSKPIEHKKHKKLYNYSETQVLDKIAH